MSPPGLAFAGDGRGSGRWEVEMVVVVWVMNDPKVTRLTFAREGRRGEVVVLE